MSRSLSRYLLPLAVALGACFTPTVSVTPLNRPPRPLSPRPVESVQVFMSGAPPGGVDVFMIVAKNGLEGRRMPAIREAAARLGCDAVVVRDAEPDTTVAGRVSRPGELGINTQAESLGHVGAVCVVF